MGQETQALNGDNEKLGNGNDSGNETGSESGKIDTGKKNSQPLNTIKTQNSQDSEDKENNAKPAWAAKKKNAFWKAIAIGGLKKDEMALEVKKKEGELGNIKNALKHVAKAEPERPKLKEWKGKGGKGFSGSTSVASMDESVDGTPPPERKEIVKKVRSLPGHFVKVEEGNTEPSWTAERPGGRVPNNDLTTVVGMSGKYRVPDDDITRMSGKYKVPDDDITRVSGKYKVPDDDTTTMSGKYRVPNDDLTTIVGKMVVAPTLDENSKKKTGNLTPIVGKMIAEPILEEKPNQITENLTMKKYREKGKYGVSNG